MALDDFYYQAVVKQHAEEAQASAARQQLIRIARAAAKRERATRREVRSLQDAVDGRHGFRQTLRGVFTDRFGRSGGQPGARPAGPTAGVASPSDAPAADRQPSADAR